MNFINRLKYYMIGVGLGILVVLAIFKDRKLTSWTPENQVIKALELFDLTTTDRTQRQMTCLEIDSAFMKAILIGGDVDFEKSKVREGDERIYFLYVEHDLLKSAVVELKDSVIILQELNLTGKKCAE